MKTDKKLFECIIYLLTAVLFVSACSTFADTAVYDLSGDLDIWQITGTMCGDDAMDYVSLDRLGCSINSTLTQDNAGKITGGGDFNCSVSRAGNSADIDGVYKITGTITQKNNIATVKLNIKISFLMVYDTTEGSGRRRFSFTETVNATINTTDYTIEGTAKIGGEKMDFLADLPAGMDGSAELSTNFSATKGTKLGGTGVLTLSNGDFYDYIIKGSYNAKKGLDSLTLTGTGKPSPGSFTLAINHNNYNLKSLKGKSLGQTLAASEIPAE